MKIKITIHFLFICLFVASPCLAFQGKCVGVSDGDTITALTVDKVQHKIRLYGIDCPEKHQDFGQRAKQFTSDMVFSKDVEVDSVDQDRYGRTVGIVTITGKSLNEELVKAGYAWVYEQYCKKATLCENLRVLQEQARSNKTGLWSHPNPVAPWDFRRGGVSQGERHAISGSFHGNTNSKVLHAPSCRYYNCKNCTAGFKTKDEAIAAGYRPCKMCVN
jgi:micrococcal nuclease